VKTILWRWMHRPGTVKTIPPSICSKTIETIEEKVVTKNGKTKKEQKEAKEIKAIREKHHVK